MGIENTTRTARENPMATVMGALGNTEGFILGQEAAGQTQVLQSEQLPAEGDWDELTKLGFVKGEPVPGDPLFVNATIPAGWAKRRTEHSLYNEVVDKRGIPRVSIGYKAAFYDRWARISIVNVGYKAASLAIYEGVLPEWWDKVTLGEKKDAENSVLSSLTRDEEYVEKYGDREDGYWGKNIARAKKALELVRG